MTSGPNRTIALAAICLSSTFALPSFAMTQTLAPHRAVYDVALKEASDRSGISGMVSGAVVMDLQRQGAPNAAGGPGLAGGDCVDQRGQPRASRLLPSLSA